MWGQVFWIPFIDFICRYWLDVFFTHFGGSSHSELVLHKMCSATIDGMSLTMVSEADSNIPSSQATSISLEPFQDRYDIFFKYLPIWYNPTNPASLPTINHGLAKLAYCAGTWRRDPSMLAKAGRALQCAWSLIQDWIPQRLLEVWSLFFKIMQLKHLRHLCVNQLNVTMSDWFSFKPTYTKAAPWAHPLRFPFWARRESAHRHAPDRTQPKWAWP